MILYLDSSALVKEYLTHEIGVKEIVDVRRKSDVTGTSAISRAEISAALSRAVRIGALTRSAASAALGVFRSTWSSLARLQISESLIERADLLAWDEGLRDFDAVHLASALIWKEGLGEDIVFATFDLALWKAAARLGFSVFPEDLPTMLSEGT